MFVIRSAQMVIFQRAAYRQFEGLMITHLRCCYTATVSRLSDDDLRSLIREGTERAWKYGVTDAYDICRYIECIATYGEDFDTQPETEWAGEILRLPGISGTARMDLIDDYDYLLVHCRRPGEAIR
jgi:hypothetical protein